MGVGFALLGDLGRAAKIRSRIQVKNVIARDWRRIEGCRETLGYGIGV